MNTISQELFRWINCLAPVNYMVIAYGAFNVEDAYLSGKMARFEENRIKAICDLDGYNYTRLIRAFEEHCAKR